MARQARRAYTAELRREAVNKTITTDTLATGGKKNPAKMDGKLMDEEDKKTKKPKELTKSNEDAKRSGVMCALMLTPRMSDALAVKGGEPAEALHVTLAYLGQKDDMPEDFVQKLSSAMNRAAIGESKIQGVVGGLGRFQASDSSDGHDVIYASFSSPELSRYRERLIKEIEKAGLPVKNDHGFTPHITLAYVKPGEDSPVERVERRNLAFRSTALVVGNRIRNRTYFNGSVQKSSEETEDISNEDMVDTKITIPLCKVEEERRLVTGIVLEPDEVDAHNDTVSMEEIENAAYNFLSDFNRSTQLGFMHKMFGEIGVRLVESWISRSDQVLGGAPVKKGSWVITVKVEDDRLWKRIKEGQITGFSIGGTARII